MPLDARAVADLGSSYYQGQSDAQQYDLREEQIKEYKRKMEQDALIRQKLQGLVPAEGSSQYEQIGTQLLGAGDFERGLPLMNFARQSQSAEAQAKDTRIKRKDEIHKPFIQNFIENGDNDGLQEYVQNNMASDPDYKDILPKFGNAKITGKGKFEFETVMDIPDNKIKYPGTDTFVPAGKYKIKGKLKNIDDKNPTILGIEPYQDKGQDLYEPMGYGQMRNKVTGEIKKVPVNPSGDMTDLNRSLKEMQLENAKEGKIRQNREDVTKAMDYAKDELTNPKNFEGFGKDKKLKSSAFDSIKTRLNSVGKDIAVDYEPAKKEGKIPGFREDIPEKFNYRVVDKKEQGPPPSTLQPVRSQLETQTWLA